MRLLKLEVESFRGLRSAELTFGPELTVVHGPNDLGKSTLAEAIRAAFLIPPTSSEAQSYVPWGRSEPPKARVTFEVDGVTWRVEKIFGTGTRGKALLEKAAGPGRFSRVAQGRDVEGKLRELLSWGISPPGGRGAPTRPQSFLTTALLGRQGEVSAVFTSSLSRDQDETGRTVVTRALDALGQDPVVTAMLARLEEDLERVFTPTGQFKRVSDSPLAKLRIELLEQENKLRDMDQAMRAAKVVEDEVLEAINERDHVLTRHGEAKRALETARERDALSKSNEQQVKVVERIRDELTRAEAIEQQLKSSSELFQNAQARLDEAIRERVRVNEVLKLAEEEAAASRGRAIRAEASKARALELASSERERHRAELESRYQVALGRKKEVDAALAAADEAERAQVRLDEAKTEFERTATEVERAQQALDAARVAERVARFDQLQEKCSRAVETYEALAATEVRAKETVAETEHALDTASSARDSARTALQTEARRSEARAIRLKEFETDDERARLGIETTERTVARLIDAAKSIERVVVLEKELDDARREADRISLEHAETVRALDASERELTELRSVEVRMRRRLVSDQIAALREEERSAIALRQAAADKRAEALRLEAEVGARRMPTAEQVARWRQLQSEMQQADVPISSPAPSYVPALAGGAAAGVVVTLLALFAFAAPLAVAAGLGVAVGLAVAFALNAFVRASANSELARNQEAHRSRLLDRWNAEVVAALAAASLSDLADFERTQVAHEASRRRVESLRREAGSQDEASAQAMAGVVALPSLVREHEELSLKDDGRDDAAVEARLEALGSDVRALLAIIRDVEAKASALRVDRERLNQERALATTSVEGARLRVDSARSDRDRTKTADGEDLDASLAGAREENERAKTDRERIRLERDGFLREDKPIETGRLELEAGRANEAVNAADAQLRQSRQDLEKAIVAVAEARARREQAEAALAASRPEGTPETSDGRREAVNDSVTVSAAVERVDQAKQRQSACAERVRSLEEAFSRARMEAERLGSLLGEPVAQLRSAIDLELDDIRRRLEADDVRDDGGQASLDALARDVAEAEEAARKASERFQTSRAAAGAAATAESEAQVALEGQRATLDARQQQLDGLDVASIRLQLQQAEQHPALTGMRSVDPLELQQATRAFEAAEAELRSSEGRVNETRGKLQSVAGHVGAERLEQQRELVERLHSQADNLQRDFEGARLLKERLEGAEAGRASHLGRALATPVTRLFDELTQGRYDSVNLDPDLEMEGVAVAGETRDVNLLSVGTREQLATLIRLAVAAHLKTAIVLDDQLVHSDAGRLEWFRERLRSSVRQHGHQAVVFTCRPNDYLNGRDGAGTAGESVLVIDLVDVAVR